MSGALDILVVGGGMYVTGRGTETYGTIMPALLEGRRKGTVGRIGIVTTNSDSANRALNVFIRLSNQMGLDEQCEIFPKTGIDSFAYLTAADIFNPDAVIVSVPDHLHASISIALIGKGLHCLVVKPLAPTVIEAESMIEASKKANVVAEVEFHKRLDESNMFMCDKLRTGQLGKLLYAVVEYSQQKRIPCELFKAWSGNSNVFQYLGVHYVDLIHFATNFTPLKVTAWGQKDYLPSHGIDTWDAIQVVIEWQRTDGNSFVSTHLTNWVDPNETSALSDQKINIVGTKGRYQADQKNRGVQTVLDVTGVQDINPYFSSFIKDAESSKLFFQGYGIRSVLRFLHDILSVKSHKKTLNELEQSRPTFNNCIVSTAVVEAVGKSLQNSSVTIDISL